MANSGLQRCNDDLPLQRNHNSKGMATPIINGVPNKRLKSPFLPPFQHTKHGLQDENS